MGVLSRRVPLLGGTQSVKPGGRHRWGARAEKYWRGDGRGGGKVETCESAWTKPPLTARRARRRRQRKAARAQRRGRSHG